MKSIHVPAMDAERVAKEIGDFVIEQVRMSNATGAVVGLSGGVDSTTVAATIKRAFDRDPGGFELVGLILPSATNQPADTEDGTKVAQRLGIRYETYTLQPLLESYRTTNPEAFENKFDRGNLTSRVRATVLNTKAATERKILAGTGNRDEDYGIGYYTLFGDGAVHISPIGGLSKRLVKELASHLGFTDLAHREPTAGLEPGQTDFKDLGYSYEMVELVTEGFDQKFSRSDVAEHPQITLRFEAEQARYATLFGKAKFASTNAMIDDIMARHAVALRKASLISPAIAPVTLDYR
ncbi:MAG: NAD(+) synthase [Burkholderiales bacterium]